MGKVDIFGAIKPFMLVIGKKTPFKETENIYGLTDELMMENGKIIKCTGKVSINGAMAVDMKVNFRKIRSMDLVNISNQMELNI